MKKTGVCPKCASTDIRVSRRQTLSTVIQVGWTLFGGVYWSRFICTSCGFTEAWVESQDDLRKLREKLPTR